MRRLAFACIAASLLSVSACTTIPVAPVTVAQTSVLDEQGAIGVELAYKAARLAVETAVGAGLIKGQRAVTVAQLDNRAFAAVTAVRAAYRTGNAVNYAAALLDAQRTVAALLTATGGN